MYMEPHLVEFTHKTRERFPVVVLLTPQYPGEVSRWARSLWAQGKQKESLSAAPYSAARVLSFDLRTLKYYKFNHKFNHK
ncbi:hypothetical protein O9K51_00522 [Purpureocillium lavendulum]|uniref:Uncharacterized protein n=1 Tax=Purpureocillium lavendulum TaxID=1247861 RepID=A0AB34G3P3_9HYPO|nr:hypothetical protein O9K51_00522 [Purpureocillium lavendulum]